MNYEDHLEVCDYMVEGARIAGSGDRKQNSVAVVDISFLSH